MTTPTDRDLSAPHSIFFFPNGMAAVCDGHGQQMPKYQRGWHGTTVEQLAADGIDWRTIPDRQGEPNETPPCWWSPERQAKQDAEWEAAQVGMPRAED
jgi:hypothetical protein